MTTDPVAPRDPSDAADLRPRPGDGRLVPRDDARMQIDPPTTPWTAAGGPDPAFDVAIRERNRAWLTDPRLADRFQRGASRQRTRLRTHDPRARSRLGLPRRRLGQCRRLQLRRLRREPRSLASGRSLSRGSVSSHEARLRERRDAPALVQSGDPYSARSPPAGYLSWKTRFDATDAADELLRRGADQRRAVLLDEVGVRHGHFGRGTVAKCRHCRGSQPVPRNQRFVRRAAPGRRR